jgi:dTMP kinase
MPAPGKLIAFEGIDGSGKRTQVDLLAEKLEARGVPFARMSFPRYTSFFGTLVGRYLNGDFGRLDQVDPHLAALLYAGDRFEAKAEIAQHMSRSKLVVADRYIGSNLAHQAARVPAQKRDLFLAWLRRLEYQVYALPEEDLVVYLRLPAAEAQRLIGMKSQRDYTEKKRDIHEADLEHLRAAAEVYDLLSREPNWTVVECWDAEKNGLRQAVDIHAQVMETLMTRRIVR